jgi:hypothetical protein
VRRRRTALLLLSCGVALGACGDADADREPGPRTLDDHLPEIVGDITVDEGAFDPDELSLDAGQGIELTNTGDDPIRVVGTMDTDVAYDTGLMHPDEATILVFDEPGTVELAVDGEDPGLVVTARPIDP